MSETEKIQEETPKAQTQFVHSFDVPNLLATSPTWDKEHKDSQYEYKLLAKDTDLAFKEAHYGWEADPNHPDQWHDLKLYRRPRELGKMQEDHQEQQLRRWETGISEQAIHQGAKEAAGQGVSASSFMMPGNTSVVVRGEERGETRAPRGRKHFFMQGG
jgi:hypothetical protein